MKLNDLLSFAVKNNASDLHLSSGMPAMIRVNGKVRRIDSRIIEDEQILGMLHSIMNQPQREQFAQNNDIDFAIDIPRLARLRVNAFQQRRGSSAALRLIPAEIQTLEDIKAPLILRSLLEKPHGLILVTGATGSGKSTTLAAMLDLINRQRNAHILTIEDPIEFIHTPRQCIINQRELGPHTQSFSIALRAALREDPDVIMVGEMRDPETISLALTAAETGHLVLATLHTNSASKAIDRIIDTFSAGDKPMARAMLSESMQAIIAQNLVPTIDGGRTAVWEVLVGTNAVRNLIRENKTPQIYSTIQTGKNFGMRSMDDSLYDLVERNLISDKVARPLMRDKEKIANLQF